MSTYRYCISCGDIIGDPSGDDSQEVRDFMELRCRTCAREIAGEAMPVVRLQHDAGGGRRVIRDSKTL